MFKNVKTTQLPVPGRTAKTEKRVPTVFISIGNSIAFAEAKYDRATKMLVKPHCR